MSYAVQQGGFDEVGLKIAVLLGRFLKLDRGGDVIRLYPELEARECGWSLKTWYRVYAEGAELGWWRRPSRKPGRRTHRVGGCVVVNWLLLDPFLALARRVKDRAEAELARLKRAKRSDPEVRTGRMSERVAAVGRHLRGYVAALAGKIGSCHAGTMFNDEEAKDRKAEVSEPAKLVREAPLASDPWLARMKARQGYS